MGIINTEVNAMLERPAIFADLVNGLLHGGEQVLKPEDLTPLPLRYGVIVEEDGRRKAVERTGDVRMRAENDVYSVTFFDETQAKVDYGMPVRNMLYDALEYRRQVQEMEKGHRERRELKSPEELLPFVADYRLNIIPVRAIKEPENYKSCLHTFFIC